MVEQVPDGSAPLVEKIFRDFAQRIETRELAPGARLPSVRQLSAQLGVSVFTVVNAYDRLVATGRVNSRRGAGFFVASHQPEQLLPSRRGDRELPDSALELFTQAVNHDLYKMAPGSGYLPTKWGEDAIAPATWAKVARRPESMRASPPQGMSALRDQLAIRCRQNGIDTKGDDIVTTYGGAHAFELICTSVLCPGDVVFVEDPGFFLLPVQIQQHGMQIVGVPRLADGPDVDRLEELAAKHRPRAFFTQTLLHNPVGGSTSATKCHRILSLAERFDFLVVEDDVYGEFAENRTARLAQMDSFHRVVYVGSFSKVLAPGIRVGFAILPASLKAAFVRKKILSVIGTSSLVELVVAETLATGQLRHHVDALRERIGKARSQAIRALEGAGIEIADKNIEGFFLWGKMPDELDVGDLVRRAHAMGILLAHGGLFSPSGGCQSYLRFSAPSSIDPRLLEFLSDSIRRARTPALRLVNNAY
ncbi:putative GntR family transcriptional regulator [Burkholderiales bacterium]|jgi:DNA-binding transcriptional MocR family regulator|nr:putative GntR family transcriptional regulator [Burkholderiales bacterium]